MGKIVLLPLMLCLALALSTVVGSSHLYDGHGPPKIATAINADFVFADPVIVYNDDAPGISSGQRTEAIIELKKKKESALSVTYKEEEKNFRWCVSNKSKENNTGRRLNGYNYNQLE